MTPSGPYMTQEMAAKWLGVSEHTLAAAIKRGEVPGVRRVGGRVLINKIPILLEDLGIDLGTLSRQLGVKNIDELIAFFGETERGSDGEDKR